MRAALAIMLGERCVVCRRPLMGQGLCPHCVMALPYINIRGVAGNCIERLFWGTTPVERASATIVYQPGFDVERLLHAIKYKNRPDLAIEVGRIVAQEHLAAGFFEGIDAIQPIPLHPNRQRERGYNQSERIAQGISEVTGLPIVDLVQRVVDNVSQTQLSHNERRQNVDHIFEADTHSAPLRHILIIDDVITTGATTVSCARALTEKMPNVRLSFLSFAYAGPHHAGRLFPTDHNVPDCTVSNADFRERQFPQLA